MSINSDVSCFGSTYISILQCNIGGAPKSRLAKGSILRNQIERWDPTLLILTETKVKRKGLPLIPFYKLFTQKPLAGSSGGIALYFKETISFRISKIPSSKTNSILWAHLQHHVDSENDLYICAVYAPCADCPRDKIISFYDELNRSTTKLQTKPGHRVLVGDFNARLGGTTGDHDTNSNKHLFEDFTTTHSLINLNVLKTWGQFTFHNIRNGSCSIIDYLLTDMNESQIPVHLILPESLGTSAQSAHKSIFSKISIMTKEVSNSRPTGRPKWRAITPRNYERYSSTLAKELSNF